MLKVCFEISQVSNFRELLEELSKTMGEDIPPKKKNFFESIFE